jgi:hypothetical protein
MWAVIGVAALLIVVAGIAYARHELDKPAQNVPPPGGGNSGDAGQPDPEK